QALEIGQLIKDEYFTLFESVGALEIMDPKMDSGFLAPGETLDDDYDILKELLPEEVVGIMDQLLCYEMAWHQGYPLSQTLFTSLHIDKLLWPEPRTLDEASFHRVPKLYDNDLSGQYEKSPMLMLLRAYCLGLIKYCDNVIQKVTSRDYFEEEDFSTHTYNRLLLTRFLEKEIVAILDQAEEWLGSSSVEETVKDALVSRLRLRKKLLEVTSPEESMEHLSEGWSQTRELLSAVEKSHATGKFVKEAFSSKIQRRLASTVPPRPVVEPSFSEALKVAVELCQDCLEVIRGTTQLGPGNPSEIMAYLWTFNSRKPQPLTYSRACLSSLIFGHPTEVYEELLRKDLEGLVLPADPILDPINWTIEQPVNPLVGTDNRAMMANVVNEFGARTTPQYLELWTTLCQNRCRTRRMMTHNLLAFNNLQLDVEVLDQDLHHLTKDVLQYPLASWTYHQKLTQMEWIVQLGFEQDVYLPDEYAGMYWWLSSIAATRAELLERILAFVSERHSKLAKADQPQEATAESQPKLADPEQSQEAIAVLKTKQHLQLYVLLHYLRIVPTPPRPFSSPALRYELRMKPFLAVDMPSLPPFEDFEADIHPFGPYDKPDKPLGEVVKQLSKDAEDLVKDAKVNFATVKKLGPKAARSECVSEAWSKDVSNVLLTCIAAGLATTGLGKLSGVKELSHLVKSGPGKLGDVESEKKYHDWWIIPKL
ncbi:uncharacterized protein K452DRAFT_219746, partial [Aplosporella prunicola CBS 121167]